MITFGKYVLEQDQQDQQDQQQPTGGFQNIVAGQWSAGDLAKEYDEEINHELGLKNADMRWPRVDIQNIPFMNDQSQFVQAVQGTQPTALSLSQIKNIYNHKEVGEIIGMFEAGKTSEEIQQAMMDEFRGHKTDVGGYPKEQSYIRWVITFKNEKSYQGTQWPPQPPILLQYNGKLFHISGQTRQAGALTNKKIMPYVILNGQLQQPQPQQPQPQPS